jgi:hypothetical protein
MYTWMFDSKIPRSDINFNILTEAGKPGIAL